MEPIAKRLRQSGESALLPAAADKRSARAGGDAEDVDAQIRRLEAELQRSGASESDASESEDGESEDGGNGGVVSLSAFAGERVEALPAQQLPPQASSASALAHGKPKPKPKTKPTTTQAGPDLLAEIAWPTKVPFACKLCAFVGADLAAFEAHRQSAAHLERAAQAPPALQCRLCAKAFTSPSQLAEHKAGKWHQQRLQRKKERHVVRVCYDFMRGSCRRGDRCAFEHAETKAMRRGEALSGTKRRACDAFARAGSCRFGDRCLFAHAGAD